MPEQKENQGWRLVPIDPTQEMVRTAYEKQPGVINVGFAQAYRDMVAAAPKLPDVPAQYSNDSELRAKISLILSDEIEVSENVLAAAGGLVAINTGRAIDRLADLLSRTPAEGEDGDELGLRDLGESFLAEYERAVKDGCLKNFVCAESPVEVLWHLINEADELRLERDQARAQVETAAKHLEKRAAGYADRADSIFNGRIMAEELLENADRIRAMSHTSTMRKPVGLDDETAEELQSEIASQDPLGGLSDADRASIAKLDVS